MDPNARATPVGQHLGDIRFDEDYARFYEMYSGQRKLPPPVADRTLYQEVPGLFPSRLQQQLGAVGQAQAQILSRGVTPGAMQQQAALGTGVSCGGQTWSVLSGLCVGTLILSCG